MPERGHWLNAAKKGGVIVLGLGTFLAASKACSSGADTTLTATDRGFQPAQQQPSVELPFPQQDQLPAPQQQPEAFSSGNVCPSGFEGRQLRKGDWALNVIREYGEPGTEDSPVIYIDKKGNFHQYDNWRGFKGYQYPGETICVPHRKGSSIENKQHIVYSANVQTTNRTQRRGF